MEQERYYYKGSRKPLFFLFMLLMLLLISAVVMYLWNAIIPGITGWKTINYWQSAGLLILGRLLSGRFGPPSHHRRKSSFMMGRFREKFANANPEEREALKEEWRNRCRK